MEQVITREASDSNLGHHPIVITEVDESNLKGETLDIPTSASAFSTQADENMNVSPSAEISPAQPATASYLEPLSNINARPNFSRRPSYDLFECIEQSKHKRLSENNARFIFAQVVEAVHYLDSQGITHCDIKDENLVVDVDFRVIFCHVMAVVILHLIIWSPGKAY